MITVPRALTLLSSFSHRACLAFVAPGRYYPEIAREFFAVPGSEIRSVLVQLRYAQLIRYEGDSRYCLDTRGLVTIERFCQYNFAATLRSHTQTWSNAELIREINALVEGTRPPGDGFAPNLGGWMAWLRGLAA